MPRTWATQLVIQGESRVSKWRLNKNEHNPNGITPCRRAMRAHLDHASIKPWHNKVFAAISKHWFFFFSWLGVSRRWKVPPSPQSLAFHNFQHTASLGWGWGAAGYCAQWDPLSSLSSGARTPQGRHGCLEWPLSLGTIRALLPPPLFIISHISPMTGSKKTRRGSVPQISIFLPSTQ